MMRREPAERDLAAVDEGGVERLVDGGVESLGRRAGVGEDHVGVLAAEFEGDLLHAVDGRPGDLRAADETAREGDEVDVGVLGEPGADRVTGAGDDIGGAERESGLRGAVRSARRWSAG
ncbi:hypothetical protein GCM10020254_17990 [Streptomyces goshikiensis]